MKQIYRMLVWAVWLVVALGLSACVPMVDPQGAPVSPAPTADAADQGSMADTGAMATVSARSLRVRSEPSENGGVVAGIKEGEKYQVVAISADGQWVQLAIESAPGGSGWVSANFVTVEGAITDIGTTPVASSAAITASAAVTASTPTAGFAVVQTDGTRLRVRSEPTADAEIVGYVYNGESYQVLETSADGLWVKIAGDNAANTDNPNGGWVAAEFLVIGQ